MSETQPDREPRPTPEPPVEPEQAGADPRDGTAAEGTTAPQDREGPRLVQVTRRRAPRYRSFVLTGVALAFLLSAVVAVLAPASGDYSQAALFGYLFVSTGLVLSLLGGLAAVLADRRSVRAGSRRRGGAPRV